MRWKPHVRFGERAGETDQQETLAPRPGPTQPRDRENGRRTPERPNARTPERPNTRIARIARIARNGA
jgi:hypothetical protein